MQNHDEKDPLPVLDILGTGNYSKFRTATKPRVGFTRRACNRSRQTWLDGHVP